MAFPVFRMFAIAAKLIMDVPIIRKRTKINTSAHAAGCAENILMAYGQVKCPMTAHAKSCNGSVFSIANGFVMVVYPIDQFAGNKCLIANRRIDRTVEIPTVTTIRANEYHLILVG